MDIFRKHDGKTVLFDFLTSPRRPSAGPGAGLMNGGPHEDGGVVQLRVGVKRIRTGSGLSVIRYPDVKMSATLRGVIFRSHFTF